MTDREEIKKHLTRGDYAKIGKMCGISRKYARILLDRPGADRHQQVVTAARILARFNLENGIVKGG